MTEAKSGLSVSKSKCEFQSDCTEKNPVLALLDKLKSPKRPGNKNLTLQKERGNVLAVMH